MNLNYGVMINYGIITFEHVNYGKLVAKLSQNDQGAGDTKQ